MQKERPNLRAAVRRSEGVYSPKKSDRCGLAGWENPDAWGADLATEAAGGGSRRDFLYIATGAVGAVAVAGVVWPLIDQMNPDAATLALASMEFDLSPIETGQMVTIKWRGLPLFVRNRTQAEIELARSIPMSDLKHPEADDVRTKAGHENWLVVLAACTHLGCIPEADSGDFGVVTPNGQQGGWYCPCHGSQYDTAARIRKGPAPKNLVVPPYEFLSDTKIRIG